MTGRALIAASPSERWQRVRIQLRLGSELGQLARTAPGQRERSAAAGRRRTAIDTIFAELTMLEETGVLGFVDHVLWSNWGGRFDGNL